MGRCPKPRKETSFGEVSLTFKNLVEKFIWGNMKAFKILPKHIFGFV